MKYGVVYCSYPQKVLNGTLFYGYEHCQLLRNFVDAKFYIVGISQSEVKVVLDIFAQKYNTPTDNIVCISRPSDVYRLRLDRTVVLDVRTFGMYKEFMTGHVLCYSNDNHPMYRYRSANRQVTYFGSYNYQPRDVFSYLKLNFSIFKPSVMGNGTYISSPNMVHIADRMSEWTARFGTPIRTKQPNVGSGTIYDGIRAVHYVHTSKDKNNRTIPEAFWHGKEVTYERMDGVEDDSASLRFDDISTNGLTNYTLSEHDELIAACLR